ncbi:hypothetical protein QTI66_11535 [Variovorax sp. J22R133]|uniref:hypothetical protein n=1 Tax=Variovorax brevis TaxID=3053503 RepID=UPI002578F8EB|nr:hypothetical protein [Variovorax sp. J22R133]MDM0112782.1 hypothetical protein [Variovorax sp. J22R133]
MMNEQRPVSWLCAAALLAALSACGARGDKTSQAPAAPISKANSLVVPAITYGKTSAGYSLSASDDKCDVPSVMRTALRDKLSAPLENLLHEATPVAPDIPVLKLEITDLLANAGGIYSGPKMVEIKGTLEQQGQAVASFKARRASFPLIGLPRTTCNIVSRATDALAADTVAWLKQPVDGVFLGDR